MNCTGCKYLQEWTEHHPYGSTNAAEYFSDFPNEDINEDEEEYIEKKAGLQSAIHKNYS